MAIHRNPHRDRYTVIHNEALEDSSLSLEAKGLHAYLMSKPDGWKIHTAHLMNVGNCGRDRILRILRELEEAGYRETRYVQDANGKMDGRETIIHETSRFSESRKTRGSGLTNVADQGPLVNTEDTVNTEKEVKTDSVSKDTGEDPIKQLFDVGVKILTNAGHKEKHARSLVGKLRKAHGDKKALGMVLAASRATDPAEYIAKCTKSDRDKFLEEQDQLFMGAL